MVRVTRASLTLRRIRSRSPSTQYGSAPRPSWSGASRPTTGRRASCAGLAGQPFAVGRPAPSRWRSSLPRCSYDERRAHAAAAQTVSDCLAETADIERIEHERHSRGVTFRKVAHGYLSWLEDVKGAKPSTLADYRYLLAEPGVPYKRRMGESAGHI